MSFKQFSDLALCELSDANGSGVLVQWSTEWRKLYERYLDLQNKFEAMVEDVGDTPVNIPEICKELSALSNGSVSYEYWLFAGSDSIEHKFWSADKTENYRGSTVEEAADKFRAAYARPAEETP